MNLKKIIASVAAAAVAVTTMAAVSVSAASNVIDFEDGNYTGISMKTDDGGDNSVLSVVDFNGSKALRVDVQDESLVPKIYFDLNTIVGEQNLASVAKITFDLTLASKDGTSATGWGGGAIGLQGGSSKTPDWSQAEWTLEEYNNAVSATNTIERTVTDSLVNGTPDTHMIVMRYTGTTVPYYMYIDNVTVYDASGNAMALYPVAEAATEEATPAADEAKDETPTNDAEPETIEETSNEPAAISEDAAPATTEDATSSDADTSSTDTETTSTPDSDSTTTAAKTGNTAAAVAVSVMAVAAAAAVVSKRK